MKKNLARNNVLQVVILLLISLCCSTTYAWLPQQQNRLLASHTTPIFFQRKQRHSPWTAPFAKRINVATSTDSSATTSRFERRMLPRWFAAGLACMVLFPLRVSAASTLAEPMVAAATEPAIAAATETALLAAAASEPVLAATETVVAAAPAAVATSAAAAAYCAAPPVPASVETKLTLRLVYSALLGAGLGKERSFAKHSAGVRTMALVAMGASAYTVCSAYGFANFGHYDPGRMASNVASGVGFVGAGVITTSAYRNQNVVHGLTTAATIWLSAAVGVACGVGLFQIATTAAVATVTILRLGRKKPKHRAKQKSSFQKQFEVDQTADTYTNDEEDIEYSMSRAAEDDYAETHDTTEWDEKLEEEVSPPVQFVKPPEQERIVVAIDDEIGSVVEQAWRTNATDFIVNSTQFSVNVVEREREPEPQSSGRYRP